MCEDEQRKRLLSMNIKNRIGKPLLMDERTYHGNDNKNRD